MKVTEVVGKYGDVELKFYSYYKYTFRFVGIAPDGKKIIWDYGGDSADIYKYLVTRDGVKTLNKIFDDLSYADEEYQVIITDNGYEILSTY